MTDKLYEKNSYIREFDARVTECEAKGDLYRICLLYTSDAADE